MKDTQDVTAVVIDHGMFMPVAVKLAESMKRVYYHTHFDNGFVDLKDCIIGDGMDTIERLDDFLSPSIFDEIDLFVFPNLGYAGLQEHLAACGKAVWGSRHAEELELMKGRFYKTIERLGLEVPEHIVIKGWTNLVNYLREHDDLYIKTDRYRECMDTWHHNNIAESTPYLDYLATRFGPFKEGINFYVLEPIKTDIEGGIDNYCIDGQWPEYAVLGYEKKNKTYLATVKKLAAMPEEFTGINEAIGPELAKYEYRNFFSTEIRVKDGKSFFIDPTCRCPSPAGEEQLELYANMADIIWHGANGHLVQPEIAYQFAGEALVRYTGDKSGYKSLVVPKDVQRWVKLYGCAEYEGAFHFPPDKEDIVGCVVGVGDTTQEVIDHLKETSEQLSDTVDVDLSSFADLIKEIEAAEEAGIEFTSKPMPAAASVIE